MIYTFDRIGKVVFVGFAVPFKKFLFRRLVFGECQTEKFIRILFFAGDIIECKVFGKAVPAEIPSVFVTHGFLPENGISGIFRDVVCRIQFYICHVAQREIFAGRQGLDLLGKVLNRCKVARFGAAAAENDVPLVAERIVERTDFIPAFAGILGIQQCVMVIVKGGNKIVAVTVADRNDIAFTGIFVCHGDGHAGPGFDGVCQYPGQFPVPDNGDRRFAVLYQSRIDAEVTGSDLQFSEKSAGIHRVWRGVLFHEYICQKQYPFFRIVRTHGERGKGYAKFIGPRRNVPEYMAVFLPFSGTGKCFGGAAQIFAGGGCGFCDFAHHHHMKDLPLLGICPEFQKIFLAFLYGRGEDKVDGIGIVIVTNIIDLQDAFLLRSCIGIGQDF